MASKLIRPVTRDTLFLWVMHRFSEVFEDHAIIKGGMALRLLDSPRNTMDIDYVFVPFKSKKEIVERIEKVLGEIEDAHVAMVLHSAILSADLRVDGVAIKIEANVATECETIPMATGGFANSLGQPSQIVRVMNPDQALAHKIAAWNERRLLRDLYDCYFLASRAGASPDLAIVDHRLAKIQSRLPQLRKTHSMSRERLVSELQKAAAELSDDNLEQELAGILPPVELAGLALRIRTAIERINTSLGQGLAQE